MASRAARALRLGLCCQFAREPIKFRTTTATAMLRLPRRERLARLAELCRTNAEATQRARRTWKTEPFFHISSPLEGWDGPKPERHHDENRS